MGILDDLPGEVQFTTVLAPVTGDAASGTGLAGVLALLQSLDPASASSFLTSRLDASLQASVSVGGNGLTGDVTAQFDKAIALFQSDPLALALPFVSQLDGIRDVALAQIPARLTPRLDGLSALTATIPTDSATLVATAAAGLRGLQSSALSGPFDELRQWSAIAGAIRDEVSPLIAGGAGTVQERLLAYLVAKLDELVGAILSGGAGIAARVSGGLSAALTTDQVAAIAALRLALLDQIAQAKALFDAGNFADTTHLAAAQASLSQLGALLGTIATSLNATLDVSATGAAGLSAALGKQLDDLAEIEFIDLARIETKFNEAVASIETAIAALDLASLRAEITDLFARLQEIVDAAGLSTLTAELNDLHSRLQPAAAALDGALLAAVAAIQGIFAQTSAALATITSALGTMQDGVFTFHTQEQIETFLNGIKTAIAETVQPALAQFTTTIAGTLAEIQSRLEAVQDAIASVVAQFQQLMQGVIAQLQALDVPATMEEIGGRLDAMIAALGEIDFAVIVDPVIAEIASMRDTLAQIDVSAMSEITVGALKVSVEVVTNVDFSTQITAALMAEFDEILQAPLDALAQIEGKVESAVGKLADFGPDAIVAPLEALFAPVQEGVDALSFEPLVAPIASWHAEAVTAVAAVTPGALLQPVVTQYDALAAAVASVEPAELVNPLSAAIADLRAELAGPLLSEPLAGFTGMIARARELVASLAPERLLAPLRDAFDTVMTALAGFRPSVLLAPVTELFALLTAPINALNAAQVAALRAAFDPIRNLPAAVDPAIVYDTIRQAQTATRSLLAQLDLGGLLTALKSSHDALSLSFQAGGPGNVSLAASVTALNPLQDPTLGQAVAALTQAQTKLDAALAQPGPPADLVTKFDALQTNLESLLPSWVKSELTVAQTKDALKNANPGLVAAALDRLYDALLAQVQALDPRLLETDLAALFTPLDDLLAALDPAPFVAGIQESLAAVIAKLETVALGTIVTEAQAAFDTVQSAVAALDPRPIVAALDDLTAEVTGLLDALEPETILASLNGPSQAAKQIVQAFDPAVFKQPLKSAHAELQHIVAQIDVGALLQPLIDRLKQLRDALEAALRRTEAAFNEMLAAVPV